MRSFKSLNNLVGWLVFAIAAATYLLTLEPTASFWDCGEFIACSYKLLVPHPPGAPTFLLLGRLVFAVLVWRCDECGRAHQRLVGVEQRVHGAVFVLDYHAHGPQAGAARREAQRVSLLAAEAIEPTGATRRLLILSAGVVGALAFRVF